MGKGACELTPRASFLPPAFQFRDIPGKKAGQEAGEAHFPEFAFDQFLHLLQYMSDLEPSALVPPPASSRFMGMPQLWQFLYAFSIDSNFRCV